MNDSTYRYQCTECDTEHRTFDAAAHCHWGIGGVVEVPQDVIYSERKS